MDKKFFQTVKTIAAIALISSAANALTCVETPDGGWPKDSKACLTSVNQVGPHSDYELICSEACEETAPVYKKYWYIYLEPHKTIKQVGLYCACGAK